jgi:thiol-disulfide isomerase/thioredoxin
MIHRISLAAVLSASLGLVAAQAATVQRYQQAGFAAAQQADKPILIFVEALWCPACTKERHILFGLYDTPEFEDLLVFTVDFDIDKPLLLQFKVRMPSTLIVYHGGKEAGRATSVIDPVVIKTLLETSKS